MVNPGGRWTLAVLRRATQLPGDESVPGSVAAAVVASADAARPEGQDWQQTHGPYLPTLASTSAHYSSVSRDASGRHDPRQEPGAVAPHAGIRAGGDEQSSSLPRQNDYEYEYEGGGGAPIVSGGSSEERRRKCKSA